MLIEGMEKVIIVPGGGYGDRWRAGNKEFHYGVDIRVVDKEWKPLRVCAPEQIQIAEWNFDPKWGHWMKAEPMEPNELGIDEFRFWHQKPGYGCVVGAVFEKDDLLCVPEAGYVDLHLHFATLISGEFTDPMPYLKLRELV